MRALVPIIFLIIPAIASAQPQPQSRCDVTIVRAPADVRPIVQHWIDAEPRCRGSLEVRIIATEGGYYLLARDERGHTNERIVPDAQSAGVLIASWAADDRSVGLPAPEATPAPMAAPTPAPTPAPMAAPAPAPMAAPTLAPMYTPMLTAPGATPMYDRPFGVDGGPARRATDPRWLSIGALVAPNLVGARLDMDLMHGHWWAVGVAGSVTDGRGDSSGPLNALDITMIDAKGLAFAALTLRSGGFELRGSFGLGLAYTSVDALFTHPTSEYGGAGLFGIADLSLLLGYNWNETWGVTAGPVATYYNQSFDLTSTDGSMTPMTFHRGGDLSLFMALRHRL